MRFGVVLGVLGVISGITASGSWRTWMLFANQVPFGKTDPQFHIDLSFFVFTYPFIRMVLSYLFAAVLISLVLATLVHYLYGGLRMQGRHPRVTMAAQAHLFVLFGVFVLLTGLYLSWYWYKDLSSDVDDGVINRATSWQDSLRGFIERNQTMIVTLAVVVIAAAIVLAYALRRRPSEAARP